MILARWGRSLSSIKINSSSNNTSVWYCIQSKDLVAISCISQSSVKSHMTLTVATWVIANQYSTSFITVSFNNIILVVSYLMSYSVQINTLTESLSKANRNSSVKRIETHCCPVQVTCCLSQNKRVRLWFRLRGITQLLFSEPSKPQNIFKNLVNYKNSYLIQSSAIFQTVRSF